MKTRKLTIRYWNLLEEGSKRRALAAVFPTMPAVVNMLLKDKPKKDDPWWFLVFKKVSVPAPDSDGHQYWKTCINKTFYM